MDLSLSSVHSHTVISALHCTVQCILSLYLVHCTVHCAVHSVTVPSAQYCAVHLTVHCALYCALHPKSLSYQVVTESLGVVDTDDLVDPPDEGRHLDIHTGHVLTAAPETPGHKTCKFMVPCVFTDQRSASVSLTGIVTLDSTGTEAGGGKDENLFRHDVDLPDTFVVVNDRNSGLPDSEGNRTRLSHVAVSSDCTLLPSSLTCAPNRETHQTNSLLEFSVPVQLEEGDVVIEGLTVVVVVDVGSGNSQGLGSGTPELLSEVVVSNSDIDSVTRAYNVCDTVRGCEDPGLPDQRPTA
jgi:hypothetical protein